MSETLAPNPTNLLSLLERAAATDKGLSFGTPKGFERRSYSDLLRGLPALAASLLTVTGRPAGLPVLLVMSNSEPLVSALFAAQWAGLIPAIIAPLRPFGDAEDWAQKLEAVSQRADGAPIIAPRQALRGLSATAAGRELPTYAWEDIISTAMTTAPAPCAHVGPETIALLQFTSGSLSHPKGVMLSHGAVTTNAIDTQHRMAVTPEDRFAFWVPLVHDMAVMSLMTGVAAGVEQWIMPTEFFAMDPLGWLRLMATEHINFSSGPPFAFEMVRRRAARTGETFDLTALRGVVCGAEPIDASILRRFSDAFTDGRQIFLPSFGLAEMCCAATMGGTLDSLATAFVLPPLRLGAAVPFCAPDAPGAVEITGNGPLLATTRLRVIGDNGAELTEGFMGRVQLHGASMMDGYWRDAEATAEVFEDDADGVRWLRTGDLGFTHGGHIYIAGREKDVIIIRGRHFFPEELDALIQTITGVRHRGVLTFGEADPSGRGEIVTAVLETDDILNTDLHAELTRAVKTVVADRLDLTVDRVVFTLKGSLPRTTSGKPRRGVARTRWGHRATPEGDTP